MDITVHFKINHKRKKTKILWSKRKFIHLSLKNSATVSQIKLKKEKKSKKKGDRIKKREVDWIFLASNISNMTTMKGRERGSKRKYERFSLGRQILIRMRRKGGFLLFCYDYYYIMSVLHANMFMLKTTEISKSVKICNGSCDH